MDRERHLRAQDPAGSNSCVVCPPFGWVRPCQHLNPGLALVGDTNPTRWPGCDKQNTCMPTCSLPASQDTRALVSFPMGLWTPWNYGEENAHVLGVGGGGPGTWELWESTEGHRSLSHVANWTYLHSDKCKERIRQSLHSCHISVYSTSGCLGLSHFLRANDSFILLWATTFSPLLVGLQELCPDICSNCACVIGERHSLLHSLPNLHTGIAFQMHLNIDLVIRHR